MKPEEESEPLDPAFVERIRAALADPRRSLPAAEARASIDARHKARLKRGT